MDSRGRTLLRVRSHKYKFKGLSITEPTNPSPLTTLKDTSNLPAIVGATDSSQWR